MCAALTFFVENFNKKFKNNLTLKLQRKRIK